MEITLPGHDQANPILADHIEKRDIQKAQMTTDYLSDNLFDEQHPVIQWLKQSVQRAVVDYAQNLGDRLQPRFCYPGVGEYEPDGGLS